MALTKVADSHPGLGRQMSRIATLLNASSILWLCVCLFGGPPAFAADGKKSFNLSEPAPGVFVHLGRQLALDIPDHDDIANIGFIVGAKCVAVIDTGGSVTIGRQLRAAIRERTQLPICHVINTHVHVDHVLGNFAFSNDKPGFVGPDFVGPDFIGHAALRDAIVRSRDFFVKEYGNDLDSPPSAGQVIGPDRLVEHELDLDLGNRHLQLRAWPKAHTDCDLTVYDLQTGTLWTGDLLFRERLPALDGSIKGWLAAIDELARSRVKLVVPGHGAVTRDLTSALIRERRYLQALVDGVRSEISQGKPMEDAIAHVGQAEKSNWLLWNNVHQHNVARVYEELEWE